MWEVQDKHEQGSQVCKNLNKHRRIRGRIKVEVSSLRNRKQQEEEPVWGNKNMKTMKREWHESLAKIFEQWWLHGRRKRNMYEEKLVKLTVAQKRHAGHENRKSIYRQGSTGIKWREHCEHLAVQSRQNCKDKAAALKVAKGETAECCTIA